MTKRLSILLGALATSTALLPGITRAQGNLPSQYLDTKGSLATDSGLPTDVSLVDYILNIIGVALGLVGMVTVILVLYAGFTILTSAGNEEKIKHGKDILIWAFVGLLIVMGSLGIVVYLNTFIG